MTLKWSYQKFLSDEFRRRQQRNLAYSLRAFARDLGLPAPKLSQYLRGTCGISAKKAEDLAAKIRLSPIEVELFVVSAQSAHARDAVVKELAQKRMKELLKSTFSELNLERFTIVRDWYHMALLALTELDQYEGSVEWMARALSMPKETVEQALNRLESVNLLSREDGKWIRTQGNMETPIDLPSSAVREYHHQMIDLVQKRFDLVPVEKREISSSVFAIDPELVPEIKHLIQNFQKDLSALIDRSPKRKDVYVMNLQLMPVVSEEAQQ